MYSFLLLLDGAQQLCVANRLWEKFIGACFFGDGQKFSMKKDSRRREERRKWRRRWWLREIKKLDQRLLTTENNKSRIKHERERARAERARCFGEKRERASERDDAKSN
jgi:hypothetical protein